MGKRAIFFDLDDTLIAYSAAQNAALCAVAGYLSESITPEALGATAEAIYEARFLTDLARLATISTHTLHAEVTELALTSLGIDDPRLAQTLTEIYLQALQANLSVLPQAIQTLQSLQPTCFLGLITNGPGRFQREKLAWLGLTEYFDAIVVDTEFGCSKPARSIFEAAAALVSLPPDQLIFVGNDPAADIIGAKNAGWKAVHLTVEIPGASEADAIIASLSELSGKIPILLEQVD
jgi:putative hydrolase of the HAD superfamily